MGMRLLRVATTIGTFTLRAIQYGCLYHCVTTYAVSVVSCEGRSMEPTIHSGDAFIVDCVSVYRHKLRRGDVVGVKSLDNPNKYLCKRIVAMSGDEVYNNVSQVYVWVPKGHVWLEGDNKYRSNDSRFYGPVPYGLINCRLVCRIWSGKQHKVHMSKDR